LTVVLGLLSFFLLPDSLSHSTRWLSEDEIQYLNFLYQKHRGGHAQQNEPQREGVPAEKTNKLKVLGSVLTDWQIFLQSYLDGLICAYVYA
jgi:hypothetical protein